MQCQLTWQLRRHSQLHVLQKGRAPNMIRMVVCSAGRPADPAGWLQTVQQVITKVVSSSNDADGNKLTALEPATNNTSEIASAISTEGEEVKSSQQAATDTQEPPAPYKGKAAAEEPTEEKSDDYTEEMQAKMGTTLTYRHEDGINYNFVLPDLIVGSCLQGPDDVDKLVKEAGVTTVFNLQEDCDMEYFSIDIAAIRKRCEELGVQHVRFPVKDFDPFDLRKQLPKAVARLAAAHSAGQGVLYIHCTAGLGRAPATALAYMFWLRGWQLPEALEKLTSVRACSPRIESIRAATADLLTDGQPVPVTVGVRRRGTARTAQVAGLDIGWHTLLDLVENPAADYRLEITRELMPGQYPFKFVIDGKWCANFDYEIYKDGNNTNNVVTALPRDSKNAAVFGRLLSATGDLLPEERKQLAQIMAKAPAEDSKPQGAAVSTNVAEARKWIATWRSREQGDAPSDNVANVSSAQEAPIVTIPVPALSTETKETAAVSLSAPMNSQQGPTNTAIAAEALSNCSNKILANGPGAVSTEDDEQQLQGQINTIQEAKAVAAGTNLADKRAPYKGNASAEPTDEKSDEYTEEMQAKMGTTLTYRHEDGMNYDFVLPDLIVGSCLQTAADVDKLVKEAGVTTVFSLQEDCDMEYFGIDITCIQQRCQEVGLAHVRFPVRDFDPFDLRQKLPKAVSQLAKAHNPRHGVVYIHCTAGLGRAPATALAYMFWLRGWQLPEALEKLTSVRACSPRIESIRAATADLLTDGQPVPVTVGVRRRGTARTAQVAGLDVGWHTLLDLEENPADSVYNNHRLEITRELMPGQYPFKFVIDGKWCICLDYPTYQDGGNVNNIISVLPRDSQDSAKRQRLLSPTGDLTADERQMLSTVLCPWSTHTPSVHMP